MIYLYWIMFTISALVALVMLYFFIAGLTDGSVSSANLLAWLFMLVALAGVVGGSWWLKGQGRLGVATAVLLIPAIRGLLYGLFVLLIMGMKPDWK